jgi:tetratricopeptide (TPR) repeat protein
MLVSVIMRRQRYAYCSEFGCFFRPLPPRAALIGIYLLLAVVVAAQNNLEALLGQARAAEKEEDYRGAARIYDHALVLAPGNLEVLKRYGVLEQSQLKFDDSIAHFRQVLSSNPKYPEVNFYLGVSYFGKNNLGEAIKSFQNELAIPKAHPRCRYYLALALQSSGRIDDAVAELNRALADNQNDADALYQLARLHKNASLQAIDRLRALDPNSFQLHALMGESYAEEKRYPEAIEEYQSALNRNPRAAGNSLCDWCWLLGFT